MAEHSRVASLGENADFSASALGTLTFPHSQMNHEHESCKTPVCHLSWLPPCICQQAEVRYQGWILKKVVWSHKKWFTCFATPLGKELPLIPWRPYHQKMHPKNQTKYSIYLSLFSAVTPQAALCFPSGWHSATSHRTPCGHHRQAPPMHTQNLLVATNQRLQTSLCTHAHLLPNLFPTHAKSLSRGTSLLIYISIKSI